MISVDELSTLTEPRPVATEPRAEANGQARSVRSALVLPPWMKAPTRELLDEPRHPCLRETNAGRHGSLRQPSVAVSSCRNRREPARLVRSFSHPDEQAAGRDAADSSKINLCQKSGRT